MTTRITLEYIGEDHPFRDIAAFVAAIKRRAPRISQAGVDQKVAEALLKRTPRTPGIVKILFGTDILTDDLESLPAWEWLTPVFRAEIGNCPMNERNRYIYATIDGMIPLANSYVWRVENNWMQEVTEADVAVIRRSEARGWFRNPHRANGPHQDPRSYDLPVMSQETFRNPAEFTDFLRDQERIPHWSGV